VAAAEPADLAFHAAFLVRSLLAGEAEERVEPVMGAQRDEPLRLRAVSAPQHPDDRRLEVVVTDPAGTAPKCSNASTCPSRNASCAWVANATWERPARAGQPQHEQPQLHQHSRDHRVELTEVDLGLRAGRVGLRHADLDAVQAKLSSAASHIPRHRHLRQDRAVLGDQPLPDPPGGVPLLARHQPIGQQPAVNHGCVGVDRGPGPLRVGLARRRHRRIQCLPHRPPVHVMPIGQLPDRGPFDPAVFPDLLEQFHS
jgi:hypothetical protein